MSKLRLFCVLMLAFLTGCTGNQSVMDFVKEGGLEATGLVNLALDARITVSKDNPDHPASTLNNGIISSEKGGEGEGWESGYEGRFARGGYVAYGMEDPYLAEDRGFDDSFDSGDTDWRGLRLQTASGRDINTSLGWVIVEFPEKKLVNRVVIYTINSQKFPADKFGVRDVSIQYWNDTVNTWASLERLGKVKGQTTNAIRGNKSGIITFRANPVKTSRIRVIVRWTNDSRERRRGRYMYTKGVVRLLEIQVYGYEKKEVDKEALAIAVTQDANEIAEIEAVIDNYVDGYNRRNVDLLMASVSEDYSKDGETYSDLWKRMESIMAQYERVKIQLPDVKITLTEHGAVAISKYSARYGTSADESLAAGVLKFQLSKSSGHWKITRIDSQ